MEKKHIYILAGIAGLAVGFFLLNQDTYSGATGKIPALGNFYSLGYNL